MYSNIEIDIKKRLILYVSIIFTIIIFIPLSNISIENQTDQFKVKSGLVISDALNNENQTKQELMANQQNWHYTGSAVVRNAPYDLYKDPRGLHIGVQSTSNKTYAGFFAGTPHVEASLFHAVISSPLRTIPSSNSYFQNGLYVQTANGSVNYVTCVSITNLDKTVWSIVSATGGTGSAEKFHVLWADSSPNQPLTRDCTIITNGQNYLKVYLDNALAYSNNTLQLQMPQPFIAFLEAQSSYDKTLLYGTYDDFYATLNENIDVANNPLTATTVKIVNSTGSVLASAPISNGNATLNIGKFHFPLTANIIAYNSTNAPLASTSSPVNIFGGDVYSFDSKVHTKTITKVIMKFVTKD